MTRHPFSIAAALLWFAGTATAQELEAPWDARAAEHLYNRAAFGARPAELAAAVEMGRAACVRALLGGPAVAAEPFAAEHILAPDAVRDLRTLPEQAQRPRRRELRRRDARQVLDFGAWWIDEMLEGEDPLRERMTLFWHGFFTSSARDVKSSVLMIEQNELLREHALGNFRDLAHGIVRDPAMLKYLDNDDNEKEEPNENLARELMELFTLGEGHYTEQDVREAARALTGWTVRRGRFDVARRRHDDGEKRVLGQTGRFDADDIVEILLAQEACPRWLAGRLLEYFEGKPPVPERHAEYAEFLREVDYDIARLLERLFHDPAFYASETVAARIASPLDYLVGTSRRLGIRPPPHLIAFAPRASRAGRVAERGSRARAFFSAATSRVCSSVCSASVTCST